MTNPDFRALCAELVELSAPADSIPQLTERLEKLSELAIRARALLDQPVVEGPTDEELWELYDDKLGQFGFAEDWPWIRNYARAVLARWGRTTPQPPAAGEVAELVEGLKLISDGMSAIGHESDSWFVARAAELLQRQYPQPVTVSKRPWEREGWCKEPDWAGLARQQLNRTTPPPKPQFPPPRKICEDFL